MKFLFDENVHSGLLAFLTKLGHDVKLCPKMIDDGEVLKLACSEQRLLITRDKHFTEDRFVSSEHFGIWLLRVRAKDLESQKAVISKLLKQFSPEKLKEEVIRLISAEEFKFL